MQILAVAYTNHPNLLSYQAFPVYYHEKHAKIAQKLIIAS